jgi:hypothetical protein
MGNLPEFSPDPKAPKPLGPTVSIASGGVRSRVQLDSNLKRWFGRNLGLWRSRRLYFFSEGEPLRVDMMLRLEAFREPAEGDAAYRFTWWPEQDYTFFENNVTCVPEGTMEAYVCGNQLRRNRGYLCSKAMDSQIRQVDEHELIFESYYEQWRVLEQIRLVDQDRYRSRSIYSWNAEVLEMMATHHEIRVEEAGAPIS